MARVDVSVLIPSHRPALLRKALDSVERQTIADRVQILVNVSTPYWPTKINDLTPAVRGRYVFVLCDDDMIAKNALARLVNAADNMAAEIAYSDALHIDEEGAVRRSVQMLDWTLNNFRDRAPCYISSLIRADVWRILGGFDPNVLYQDWDFYYRAYKLGVRATRVPDTLFHYREHMGQGSHTIDRRNALEAIYQKHPELRRSA